MCNPNWQTICLSGRSSDNEEQGLTREMMKGPKPALITFPTFLVTIPGQRLDVSPADPDSFQSLYLDLANFTDSEKTPLVKILSFW